MHRISVIVMLLVTGCAGAFRENAPAAVRAECRSAPEDRAVAWLLPAAERAELDVWCAAVGPPVLVAPDRGAIAHGADGACAVIDVDGSVIDVDGAGIDSLLVVTWNVNVGGAEIRRLVADVRSGGVTGGPVTDFALLLQEAYRAGHGVPVPERGAAAPSRIHGQPAAEDRTSIDALAAELGLHLVYVPSMANGDAVSASNSGGLREDRGNAILSTLPLTDVLALELPLKRQRRVAITANVRGSTRDGSAWSLQLTSVHLENRRSLGDGVVGLTGAAARERQMQWLLEQLPPSRKAVLAGDLNSWTRGAEEGAVLRALRHFQQTAPLPSGPTHVSHVIFRERLDYIFARVPGGGMRAYQRAPARYGSDHYPMTAWIHFPASPAAGADRPE
jgi:endonuclease/exonuclease/phosphatase family metal-dependent hydrolase